MISVVPCTLFLLHLVFPNDGSKIPKLLEEVMMMMMMIIIIINRKLPYWALRTYFGKF
jgi:hypothetical protein